MTTILQWDAHNDVAISKFREDGIAIRCLIPWRFLFIQEHTKKVFGCPYHTRPYGDLSIRSLEEIWNGENAQEMRGSLLKHEIPLYCLNNAAACPLIFEEKLSGKVRVGDDIQMGVNDHWCLGEGWFRPEQFLPHFSSARWTGPRADIQVLVQGKRSIQLTIASYQPNIEKKPVAGSVLVDDRPVGSFVLSKSEPLMLTFPLPASPKNAIARVTIVTKNPFVPAELLNNGDTRKLGIVVGAICTRRLNPVLLRFSKTAIGGRLLTAAARVKQALARGVRQAA